MKKPRKTAEKVVLKKKVQLDIKTSVHSGFSCFGCGLCRITLTMLTIGRG